MQLLKGHGYEKTIYALAFSPDGKELASCGLDSRVRLWDLSTGKQKKDQISVHYSIRSVCYSPDGRSFAWPNHVDVKVRDRDNGDVVTHPTRNDVSALSHALFSSDSRSLYCILRKWPSRESLP